MLEISDRAYNITWVCVFLLHTGCLAFNILSAYLLCFLDPPIFVYIVYYIMLPEQVDNFPVYSAFAAVVGALHAMALLRMVLLTLFTGRLALNAAPGTFKYGWRRMRKVTRKATGIHVRSRPSSVGSSAWVAKSLTSTQLSDNDAQRSRSLLLVRWISDRFDQMFSMHSPYFHHIFTAREVVEVSAQVYQAYRCSAIITRTTIRNTFIATVILNCWSTPLVQAFYFARTSRNDTLERVTCLAIDSLLSLITSTVIPVVLFMPYYCAYDPELLGFDQNNFYDFPWFASFVTECQLIFPVTMVDFASKLMPHVSVLLCIFTIVPLIARRSRTNKFSSSAILPASTSTGPELRQIPREPTRSRHPSFWSPRSKWLFMVNILFVISGFTLMLLHIHAKSSVDSREAMGCLQKAYPWLPNEFPCLVFEYNCYRHNTSTVHTSDLEALDPNSLLWLTISQCDALVIPASIQRFTVLTGFMVYNSSLVEWEADAKFSNVTQTRLGTLYFVSVNFTSFPDGLLQLPPMISDIEFAHTNLTTLPADLHEYWPALSALYFEFCEMSEFPETLTKIAVDFLSLLGNNISNISLLSDVTSPLLSLNFNPVKHLPSQLHDNYSFSYLFLENMQLKTLPDWLHTDVETAYVYGNPYCDTILEDEDAVKCIQRDLYKDGILPFEYVRNNSPC